MITFAKMYGTRQMAERTSDGSTVTVAGDWDLATLRKMSADLRDGYSRAIRHPDPVKARVGSPAQYFADFAAVMREGSDNPRYDSLTRAHCLTMAVWFEEEAARMLAADIIRAFERMP